MRSVHIEKKNLSSTEATTRLRDGIRARTGVWLTAADAALATGLPLADAEAALLTLSTQYPARISVADDGQIRVNFERLTDPEPPGALSAWFRRIRAFLARHRDVALAAFTLCLAPIIAFTGVAGAMSMATAGELNTDLGDAIRYPLTLVGAVLALGWLFVILGLTVAVAFTFLAVLILILPIVAGVAPLHATPEELVNFDLGTHIATTLFSFLIFIPLGIIFLKHVWGFAKKVFAGEKAQWAPKFWRSVGGLVFGPPGIRVDRLADEKRLVAQIAALDGIVTTPDLMAIFGWTPAEAESEIVRAMLDYGGDVRVSEDGTVLWVFETFRGQATTSRPQQPAPLPAPLRFFGCTRRFAVLALILIIPVFLGPIFHPSLIAFPAPSEMWAWHGPGEPDPAMQHVGAWPATILLVALLARVPWHLVRKRERKRDRRRLELVGLACTHPDGVALTLEAGDLATLAHLDADIDAATGASTTVRFPWIVAARSAASRVRAGEVALVDF